MPARGRHDLRRWAAPIAFLAAVTIAVVLVHDALDSGSGGTTTTTVITAPVQPRPRPRTTTARTTSTSTSTVGAVYYTVQSGDTYGSIAGREGTTVAQLESLNPGISSNSLRVGQQIRVK
jgi:LysM repeat protein